MVLTSDVYDDWPYQYDQRIGKVGSQGSPMNLKVPDNSAGTGFDDITVTGMSMLGKLP